MVKIRNFTRKLIENKEHMIGYKTQTSIKKILKVRKWTKNRLVISLLFDHVVKVMVLKLVSNVRHKVFSMSSDIFLLFTKLQVVVYSWGKKITLNR